MSKQIDTADIKNSSQNQVLLEQLSPIQELLKRVGGQNKYQLVLFLIFGLLWFITSWILTGLAFFFDSSYTCINQKLTELECINYICGLKPQLRPQQIRSHASSIIFSFDKKYLICDLAYISTILQSMVFVGSSIGFFSISYLADNLGRRLAVIISWIICTLGVLIIETSSTQYLTGLGYLLAGLGSNPAITLGYTVINESVLGKKRQLYGVGITLFLAFGQSTIGIVFLSGWQWYQIGYILLALSLIGNVSTFFIIESPKFLASKNIPQTLAALNKIAVWNQQPKIELQYIQKILKIENITSKNSKSSLIDIFKNSLRYKSISTALVLMSIQIIYYTTSLSISSVGISITLNQMLIGVSEGIGYAIASLLINKVRRKITSIIGMSIVSGCCFILTIFNSVDSVAVQAIIVVFVGRFALCCVWLYPTLVRSLGIGWANAVGTIGCSFTPYIILLSNIIGISLWISPTLFGLLSALSIIGLNQTYKMPSIEYLHQKQSKLQQQ